MVQSPPRWRDLRRYKGVLPSGGADAARRAKALGSGPGGTRIGGSVKAHPALEAIWGEGFMSLVVRIRWRQSRGGAMMPDNTCN